MRLRAFFPLDSPFFDHLREAAVTSAAAATALDQLLATPADAAHWAARLRELEHRGDELTRRVLVGLNQAFQPPLDRELIRSLAEALDDFVDAIEHFGKRSVLYRIDRAPETSRRFARIILAQSEVMVAALPLIPDGKRDEDLLRLIVELHQLENAGDDLLNEALVTAYDGATDISSFIEAHRWRELHELLEEATDKAEDVAHALESVVVQRHTS